MMNLQEQSKGYVRETVAVTGVPFASAEEAWFWFLQAQAARLEGAEMNRSALYPRPCEPIDIFKVVDRLYRNRRITIEHLRVLKHYGQRVMAPDPDRVKEIRAHALWTEALDIMEDVLVTKGIVQRAMDDVFHTQDYMNEGTVQ